MGYQHIRCDVEQHIATIRLNRPQQLNAMTRTMLDELLDAFRRVADDKGVRAVILTGEGRGFCAGADLVAALEDTPKDEQGRMDLGMALETHYNPLVLRMRTMRQPVIAAVNGIAAGAGANLALMADLVVCARSASFLQAFVNIGLLPDAGGTWMLPRLIGAQRAMGLALLGEKLPAEKALAWGLVWDVVDDAQLLPVVQALARRLADGPAVAIERIKQAIHAADGSSLAQSLQRERELQRECGHSADFAEGVEAFLQKRRPVFGAA